MTPEQATNKYHWVKYNKESNTIELYMDHYMLSSARQCEAKFYLEHLLHIKPKYGLGRKPWFLDFGEFIHTCLEYFYDSFKLTNNPPDLSKWISDCKELWLKMDMEWYKSDQGKNADCYEEVGGWEGVSGLLIQYYAHYMSLRVRVIDTEITFGHNKEVFLGEFDYRFEREEECYQDAPLFYRDIKCYLTGRIDLLVDNGYKIGPVDHKTSHKFRGDEWDKFNPQDAVTGYILAIDEILKKNYPSFANNRRCLSSWIYHISACTPSTPRDKNKKPGPRFKVTPIDKVSEQLEDFKARQLSTFKRIAELLFNDKVPEWNTIACHNIFNRPCEYLPIHQQPSAEWSNVISKFYQISSAWDTREHATNKRTTETQEIQKTL